MLRATLLVLTVIGLSTLGGCATAGLVVAKLSVPDMPVAAAPVKVHDDREHKQLAMKTRTYDSSNSTFLLATLPPLDEVFKAHLQVAAAQRGTGALDVSLRDVDLVNQVGFAKADVITCTITSQIGGQTVKTVSVEKDNMSPFIATATQKSLDRCLAEHAGQIAAALTPPLTANAAPR